MFRKQVNNRNTRKKCEMCSKLTIKTPERRQLYIESRQCLLRTNKLKYTFHLTLVSLLFTLNGYC